MNDKIIKNLINIKSWQLVVFTILFAEIFTAISNIVLSIIWWDCVSLDLIQIGAIDAFVVSFIIAPFIIYVSKVSSQLYFEKDVLQRDVAERKRVEEWLRLLEKAVKTTKTGITYSDIGNIIRFTNPADAEMHGYSPEELMGRDVRILAPPGLKKDMTITQMKEFTTWTRESTNIRKDGTTFPVRLTSDVVLNEEGRPLGIITTCEDITERKKSEEEMKELIIHKDMFITRLGHDLKTPLTPLVTLLPIIGKREDDPELKRLLDVAIENVNNIKELVIKTIKLARASSTRRLNMESIPLRVEVEGYIRKRRFLIEKNAFKVLNDMEAGITLFADRSDIEELFYNLISNALKYTPANGEIHINAVRDGDFVTVSVRDTGIGLTAEQIEHIFDEYYKVDESRHELDSSGLGLSICKKIVESHGGRIWAESPGRGLGSTLFFTIRAGDPA